MDTTGYPQRGDDYSVEQSMGIARVVRIVYFVFGVIEVLLALRFVLKLLGANPGAGFVNAIYAVSGVFNAPFAGIFSNSTTKGAETTAVFEPSSLIAILVYTLIAYGIVKLLMATSKRPDQVSQGLDQ